MLYKAPSESNLSTVCPNVYIHDRAIRTINNVGVCLLVKFVYDIAPTSTIGTIADPTEKRKKTTAGEPLCSTRAL